MVEVTVEVGHHGTPDVIAIALVLLHTQRTGSRAHSQQLLEMGLSWAIAKDALYTLTDIMSEPVKVL